MKSRAAWLGAGVVALAVGTTACQDGDRSRQDTAERNTPGQQVEQAQLQSEKAFDDARDAQKEASSQQREAARAQEDVQHKQQELQEAQAKAQKESQEAQASQQQAQARTQQAQSVAQQAQASALEAQRRTQQNFATQQQQASNENATANQRVATQDAQQQQAANQNAATQQAAIAQNSRAAPAPGQQISGDVLSASAQEVLVSQRGEPQLRLKVGPTTQVKVDGRAASAADIQEGAQIRASYTTDASSGEPEALSIDATSRAQPVAPAPAESGESSPGVPRSP
ncbi:hypothetical protein D7Y27_39230 [Corallococcus sp. AB004]|uniref:hypothetical protein n=1 Tax=Corallococcus TaxID=83461 RepID=UPI000EA3A36E|nr:MULTISPECIES: hypothetical protein [Corallococcus]NPD26231.1 hypothetical protein [Corallococcus exiguus]NRD46569.1 hypothetical protein [Corallococcus exiguus]RKH24237.1 hypothetical protein D7V77_21515 [Corallococcus sp. CA041A]RKI30337.1 hypothetical protein D7Y27_39230 [Corallococcus sp. AB004]